MIKPLTAREERKLLSRYTSWLKRYPDSPSIRCRQVWNGIKDDLIRARNPQSPTSEVQEGEHPLVDPSRFTHIVVSGLPGYPDGTRIKLSH